MVYGITFELELRLRNKSNCQRYTSASLDCVTNTLPCNTVCLTENIRPLPFAEIVISMVIAATGVTKKEPSAAA